jgi:hypothetical protein
VLTLYFHPAFPSSLGPVRSEVTNRECMEEWLYRRTNTSFYQKQAMEKNEEKDGLKFSGDGS